MDSNQSSVNDLQIGIVYIRRFHYISCSIQVTISEEFPHKSLAGIDFSMYQNMLFLFCTCLEIISIVYHDDVSIGG